MTAQLPRWLFIPLAVEYDFSGWECHLVRVSFTRRWNVAGYFSYSSTFAIWPLAYGQFFTDSLREKNDLLNTFLTILKIQEIQNIPTSLSCASVEFSTLISKCKHTKLQLRIRATREKVVQLFFSLNIFHYSQSYSSSVVNGLGEHFT